MAYPVTIEQIQDRATEKSFERGQIYYYQGNISSCSRRGNTIEARCVGSYEESYRVQALIDATGIRHVECTCEYDWGGDCKHIVALLLTWVYEPEQFVERKPVRKTLQSMTKSDLIALIMAMLQNHPELKDVVDEWNA